MKPENMIRDKNGRFKPTYKIWSLDNFNEGYIPKHGKRFMVRIPGHHRANANGWVLRSIAAYESYHPKEIVTKDYVIHHKDENKLNDSKENLERIEFGEHTRHHHLGKKRPGQNDYLKNGKIINCDYCNKEIYKTPCEIKNKNYCSKECWYNSKRSTRITKQCPVCQKQFIVFKTSKKICCSRKCGFLLRFNKYKGETFV